MSSQRFRELASLDVQTPAFVYDEQVLAEEVDVIREELSTVGGTLLLAVKAFAIESGLRTMAPWLDGFHASSPFEARLAHEVDPYGLVHSTAPGARPEDMPQLLRLSDRFSFNSLSQWARYRTEAVGTTSPGLRINPGISFVSDERYDPCARHSKLGVPIDTVADLARRSPETLDGIKGILVHNNCESTDFSELLQVVERLVDRLDPLLGRLQWVNLGGGYLFGEANDFSPLHQAVKLLQDGYGVEVMFEPGTSLVSRAGSIVSSVVDLVESRGRTVAVLDTSVAHAPEVLEYQYVPEVEGELDPDAEYESAGPSLIRASRKCSETAPGGVPVDVAADHPDYETYLLAGASCLAGDQFGEHRLPRLEVGSRVVISDVGAYSMVQASWFNGIALPTVYSLDASGGLLLHRTYTYDDFVRSSGGRDAHH